MVSITTSGPIFVDNDVLVFAAERDLTPLGARALSEIRAGKRFITPNQFREFLNVKTTTQRNTRRSFLARGGIELFSGPRAGQIASLQAFQEVFTAVAPRAGRADAALVTFARATGFEAITANTSLLNTLTHTLGMPHRFPVIPIRNIRQ